ncbi:MAG: DUF2383 domain-containing protein [Caldilineaceae bacterium]
MTSTNRQEMKEPMQRLYDACRSSEELLYTASAQMQNRGLKGLFKRFAHQHLRFRRSLAEIASQVGFSLAPSEGAMNSIQRGWMNLRIAMIVGRANRQSAAAVRCEEQEHALLQLYNQTTQLPLPEFALAELRQQRDEVHKIYQWLQRVTSQQAWMMRFYAASSEAAQAVEQLRASGFAENQIEVTPLNAIARYEEDAEERGKSTIAAILVGILIGAALGVVHGLISGYVAPTFTPAVSEAPPLLWRSILSSGLIGIVVGGAFGSLFGFLIGRSVSEDDASLTESFKNQDATVVSVRTTPENREQVADILRVWHQRELENAPA